MDRIGRSGLLIISDTHLGPGKESGEFEHFTDDAHLCSLLHHYAEETEFTELELVIAGDFFDSIQVRVEGRLPTRVYEADALAKVQRIVRGHAEVFRALAEFAAAPGRAVTFVAGNHDPATAFPAVRRYLQEVVSKRAVFELESVERGTVVVRHGNEWDLANRFVDRRIIEEDEQGEFVRFPWGSHLVVEFISRVRRRVPDIDGIKPLGAFIRWAMLHRVADAAVVLGYFLRFLFHYRFHPRADERVSLRNVLSILRGTCYSCDMTHQAAEFFDTRGPTVLVIGHTHRAVLSRFSIDHVYVNTGTWTHILRFHKGRFEPAYRRTFALVCDPLRETIADGDVRLLEWVPGEGPREYAPTFFETHLHPDSSKLRMVGIAALASLCSVSLVLLGMAHFDADGSRIWNSLASLGVVFVVALWLQMRAKG